VLLAQITTAAQMATAASKAIDLLENTGEVEVNISGPFNDSEWIEKMAWRRSPWLMHLGSVRIGWCFGTQHQESSQAQNVQQHGQRRKEAGDE
jgi:hypothetical protein